jgi:hypothetical protein
MRTEHHTFYGTEAEFHACIEWYSEHEGLSNIQVVKTPTADDLVGEFSGVSSSDEIKPINTRCLSCGWTGNEARVVVTEETFSNGTTGKDYYCPRCGSWQLEYSEKGYDVLKT